VLHPTITQVAGFTGLGLASASLLEVLGTRVWQRWSYSDVMLTIPMLEVGLVPLFMWTVLPPVVVWFVNRQLTGGAGGMAMRPPCGRSRPTRRYERWRKTPSSWPFPCLRHHIASVPDKNHLVRTDHDSQCTNGKRDRYAFHRGGFAIVDHQFHQRCPISFFGEMEK
jgi:hypothetical protein